MTEIPAAALTRVDAPWEPVDEEALQRDEVERFQARHRRAVLSIFSWRLAVLAILLVTWYFTSGRLVDSLFVSNPVEVVKAFADYLRNGELSYHLRFTLLEVLVGYGAGVVLGLVVAGLLLVAASLQRVLHPYLMAFYAIPKIALAPLIVMWFGLGMTPKVLLSGIFVFFVVFMNTLAGLRSVSPDLINVARVMGAGRVALMRKIVLPSAVPNILIALRITVPEAMIGAIIGEFIAGNRGVGYLINAASNQFDTASVFAGIAAILIVVLLMDWAVTMLERRLMRWRPPNPVGGASMP
jgi:NitT/TauT family transport system permease protein